MIPALRPATVEALASFRKRRTQLLLRRAVIAGLIVLMLLLLVVALIARHRIKQTLILVGLLILPLLLAWFGFEVPWIGFFHPINAVLIAGLAGYLTVSEWRGRPAYAT